MEKNTNNPSSLDSSNGGRSKNVLFDAPGFNLSRYSADGYISKHSTVAVLSKGSAGAYKLLAPTLEENGTLLRLTNGTAFAHVIKTKNGSDVDTSYIENGVTGGAKGTITMAAFKGASIDLIAVDGFWHVQSTNLGVVS